MKHLLILASLFYCGLSFAAAPAPAAPAATEWDGSSLSDALIAKIQATNYEYKVCAGTEMQKPTYAALDVRKATEEVVKQCEPVLGKMREIYLTEKVPAVIIDRQLRKIRIQTTRNLLSELMMRDAAKKAGQ